MKHDAFVIIGKSGSGKGTQALLLIEALSKQGKDVQHIEMGDAFRDFLRQSNYTAEQSGIIAEEGELQPDFLANYFMAQELIKYANGERVFLFDGTPRTKRQARIMDGALRFYGIRKPLVIVLDVQDESVVERMRMRGRSDDQISAITTRLGWYGAETERAIKYFAEQDSYYSVVRIDGDRAVEDIHQDIVSLLA